MKLTTNFTGHIGSHTVVLLRTQSKFPHFIIDPIKEFDKEEFNKYEVTQDHRENQQLFQLNHRFVTESILNQCEFLIEDSYHRGNLIRHDKKFIKI